MIDRLICKTQLVTIHPESPASTPKTCGWSLGYVFRKTSHSLGVLLVKLQTPFCLGEAL